MSCNWIDTRTALKVTHVRCSFRRPCKGARGQWFCCKKCHNPFIRIAEETQRNLLPLCTWISGSQNYTYCLHSHLRKLGWYANKTVGRFQIKILYSAHPLLMKIKSSYALILGDCLKLAIRTYLHFFISENHGIRTYVYVTETTL